jgi:hypothetical protein
MKNCCGKQAQEVNKEKNDQKVVSEKKRNRVLLNQ